MASNLTLFEQENLDLEAFLPACARYALLATVHDAPGAA